MGRLASTIAVFAVVAAACTSSAVPDTTTSSVAPSTTSSSTTSTTIPDLAGGFVVLGTDWEPPSLNPYLPGGDNSAITSLHLAGAFTRDPTTGELVPDLVTEVPTVENGGVVVHPDGTMSVTWTVRPGATWSDGESITANDLAFTMEYRNSVQHACFDADDIVDASIESTSGSTLTVRYPEVGFAHEDALPWIVPRHVVEGTDPCAPWSEAPWPSSGPFVLEDWTLGRSMTFVRNPGYGRADEEGRPLPYLDGIEVRFIPETGSLVDAVLDGSVDVVDFASNLRDDPSRDLLAGAGLEVLRVDDPLIEQLGFVFSPNLVEQDPLVADVGFRRAIAAAIDRPALAGLIMGAGVEPVGPPWDRYDDVDDSAVLVADACDRAGRDCDSEPPHVLMGRYVGGQDSEKISAIYDLIADDLAAVGISSEVWIDDAIYFGVPAWDRWDLQQYALLQPISTEERIVAAEGLVDRPVPEGENLYWWGGPGSVTETDPAVTDVRRLIEQLRSTGNIRVADDLLVRIDDIVIDQVVRLPIVPRQGTVVVDPDGVAGILPNPYLGTARLAWNAALWHRPLE